MDTLVGRCFIGINRMELFWSRCLNGGCMVELDGVMVEFTGRVLLESFEVGWSCDGADRAEFYWSHL